MLTAAIVIAGWVAVYISAQRMLKRTCAQLRHEFQERIDSLAANVEARERTAVAGPTAAAAPASALVVPGEVEFLATNAVAPIALQAGATAPQGPEEATPETLRHHYGCSRQGGSHSLREDATDTKRNP